MALPNKPKGELKAVVNPEVVEMEVDALIVGGGMAACGAAFEIKKWAPEDMKILLVDKAALERSGAVAQGLSAINTYIGENPVKDYVKMVRNDLMGVVREDLIYDCGRHVDESVKLFEEWGLPVWKKGPDGENLDGAKPAKTLREGGEPVRTGKWQIMINGESYKCIVAEPAKTALGDANILERVFIVKMLLDKNKPNQIAGAAGFSVRENKVYVIKCKTAVVACGGAVNIFRPRSTGEGKGRAWYPVWNAGSTYTLAAQVGATLTMMENRFTPSRFKDGYGPVGAWFLLFKAKVSNGLGEFYAGGEAAKAELKKFMPYGASPVTPTCLRNHLMLNELKEGRGPIYMATDVALNAFLEERKAAGMDEKELKKFWKHLESEAWEDFLDMSVGQAGLWAGMNVEPEKVGSEIMPTEPYMLGSHSGCCGIWCSGPNEAWVPDVQNESRSHKYKWGYNRMTTVDGLFTAGDGVGASGHKFSSGSHAEGRIVAKQMVKFCRDNASFKPELKQTAQEIADEIYAPVKRYHEFVGASTAEDVNPNYCKPAGLMMRLMKATDEYGGGVATYYMTSGKLLNICLDLLRLLREDAEKMAAGDLHELLRCWENYHRIWCVETHIRHMEFRKESRYPGFYYRSDFPTCDDENWRCFVNSTFNPETKEWKCEKVECLNIIETDPWL
ncbi:adenylyl-sulfate reductase subunit alpha [Desulfofustis limnaeus]|jgi:adenylylsulfate reductase subunit A|uniref:Adenylylsulfate reductase subunit alpha n=1 Tax=Desulfofustis limnaeus TaxID=2740163 RepID=A0ABN6M3E3_9BACT|nr:adenylyl-sulfate reductase subunit alpha [Desulfofustis limnaeus]MDX9894647.1 adenylyl-sulfate reductase subunit alpha [Desulfofustis sp.]BDD86113.1 adenylylsulfate reductase subunit alpha [Desulfofustis limnaeus]